MAVPWSATTVTVADRIGDAPEYVAAGLAVLLVGARTQGCAEGR